MIDDWFPLCAVETAWHTKRLIPPRSREYGPGLAGLIELASCNPAKIPEDRSAPRGLQGIEGAVERSIFLPCRPRRSCAPTLAKMADAGRDPELITGSAASAAL